MKRWYLLYCKRGEQLRAKQHLENQGVDCFYPTLVVEKILRGKRQNIEEPLFPSYVFAQFDYEKGPSFTAIRSTRGVVDFVRFGAHPKEIRAEIIEELKRSDFSTEESMDAKKMPQPGDTVRVKSGQFTGFEAIFQEQDGEKRSIMLVQLITKRVPVSIDNRDLEI
ncbi:transcriptional activator RfaH [Vibrio azureus]|uniref:Transcription antitermination protein RfaH n=1 Tax=Vibrio azureus NBRC 104587 TaxID=1219077 RepID=U3AQ25_9VIBR|nr:transcription/translation regulatory transformer protein RfaH [Vibrio azureus]AUI85621.1 transcriptional activator RfaH [Vibrio azureus]GAD75865.1 transcription antitermination protein RfaH [Vibrio azureus NBRC 104587]